MKSRKNKKYIGQNKVNPIVFQKQIEKNSLEIEKNKELNDLKYRSLEDLVTLLINFSSHDIKNAVHSIDGIVTNLEPSNVTINDIESLKICISTIREVIDNLEELSLQKKRTSFKIDELLSKIEILHRPYLRNKDIDFSIEYEENSKTITIEQDFNMLIQVINNLFLNSVHALTENDFLKKIHVNVKRIENEILLQFCDNGCGILDENKGKIFKPYFTTRKGGSGVGLSHVAFAMNTINGRVSLIDSNESFKTIFELVIPIKNHEK